MIENKIYSIEEAEKHFAQWANPAATWESAALAINPDPEKENRIVDTLEDAIKFFNNHSKQRIKFEFRPIPKPRFKIGDVVVAANYEKERADIVKIKGAAIFNNQWFYWENPAGQEYTEKDIKFKLTFLFWWRAIKN